MAKINQIPLELRYPVSFDLGDYVVSSSNSDAYKFVDGWADMDAHFGAIVGQAGSGKSHLIHGWAAANKAEELLPDTDLSDLKSGQLYFLDDVNQRIDERTLAYDDLFLFHAFNWAKEKSSKILVSDTLPPTKWPRTLPDLKSRLSLVPVATIHQPDEDLLKFVLIKMFSDRQLHVNIEVINYIIKQMPRSFSSAVELANSMDKLALAEQRRITIPLAKRCLETLTMV